MMKFGETMRVIDVMYSIVRRTNRFADVYRMAFSNYPDLDQIQGYIHLVKVLYYQNKE